MSNKDENGFHYFGEYHKYWLRTDVCNPNFDDFSNKILDLKNGKPEAVDYFLSYLGKYLNIESQCTIVCIPSHTSYGYGKSKEIIGKLCKMKPNFKDGSSCLNRFKTIQKLAHKGDRSMSVHLESIELVHRELLSGQNVIILDDIITSGNSMKACRQIIQDNIKDVGIVMCVAFGKTVRDRT